MFAISKNVNDKQINLHIITGRIYAKALEVLDQNSEGIRWTDLNDAIQKAYPKYHPKTINGCIWKLTEKFPEKV